MPAVFSAAYTPVAGAGTPQQKQQVARLLAAQLVQANVVPAEILSPPPLPTTQAETAPPDISNTADEDTQVSGQVYLAMLGFNNRFLQV